MIEPSFELALALALRMVPNGPRLGYAAKLPHQRDTGSALIAHALMEQLALEGWTITAPPPPPPQRGR